jgi:hypothetical protein
MDATLIAAQKKDRVADARRPKFREETPKKGNGAKPEPYCAAANMACRIE